MTSEQASALQHLPAVLDALQALAKDLEAARSLMTLFGGVQPGVIPSLNTGSPMTPPAQTPGLIPWKIAPGGQPAPMTPEQQAEAAAADKELNDWKNSPARQKLLDEMRKPPDELPAGMEP